MLPNADQPPRPPKKGPRSKPPGGKRRPLLEIQRLVDVCEEGYLLNMSQRQLGVLLGKAAGLVDGDGKPRPMGAKMVKVYVARVRARHAANPLPGLEEARAQAARRYMQMITRLRSKADADPRTILAWETRYAQLMGLDTPRDVEAIQALALAEINRRIEAARQERAARQAQLDHEEDERQRLMIDVAPPAPEGDEPA